MGNTLSIPVEAVTATIKTTFDGTRFALRSAGDLVQRVLPGYVEPEVLAHQAFLRQFEYRLGVDEGLLEPADSQDELQARAASTADNTLKRGLIDRSTVVELRPVMSADALRDPALAARKAHILPLLRQAFLARDVIAIFDSHPIIPAENTESPVDAATVWGGIAESFDGLQHQIRKPSNHLAMLAITQPHSIENFFGQQIAYGSDGPVTDRLLVLEHVGALPEENLLGRRAKDRNRL